MKTLSNFPIWLGALLVMSFAACGTPTETVEQDPSSTTNARAENDASEDEVQYEPAYPADVSTEDLSDDDVAQQHAHSHDSADHEHGEEDDHEHGPEGDHTHDDGDGDGDAGHSR
ncbi:MAG: hypothetical protein MPN21_05625 [Thermoanaerobaculia bacterium]|nr:hypothetical protein [Thermoanaerobaculia bacterium]